MSGIGEHVKLSTEEFVKDAIEIVSRAESRGVKLRILGACAIYIHSMHEQRAINIYRSLGRFTSSGALFTDLDLMAYSKQRKDVIKFFEEELKFKYDPLIKALFSGKRLIYFHPQNLYHVDVFFDVLEFNHDVYFGKEPGKGRLELDNPTISLADLVLEKLQITKINLKDLVDLAVLFRAHDICGQDIHKECIDGNHIATILSGDWGFWYDATSNLGKLIKFLEEKQREGLLDNSDVEDVRRKTGRLMELIDKTPKTKNWIKRSKIGTSKPWYREVEEVVR
ncbi:MAG: hypothetical protein QXP97_07340 [Desulfurococcus sp.]|jgi:hypothetical protein|uniref:hypothetical protein n=1 Tax=Desulfurococcus sp. TaxID=51678 RepID=UPI0031639C67